MTCACFPLTYPSVFVFIQSTGWRCCDKRRSWLCAPKVQPPHRDTVWTMAEAAPQHQEDGAAKCEFYLRLFAVRTCVRPHCGGTKDGPLHGPARSCAGDSRRNRVCNGRTGRGPQHGAPPQDLNIGFRLMLVLMLMLHGSATHWRYLSR